MKYFEVSCEIRPFSQDAADVLSAVLAEIGFESFSQTENGVLAYIQQSVWSEDAMQEVVGNYEPFHPKSCFMYKDREGTLHMGPLWDFDWGTFKKDYYMMPVYHYSIWYNFMKKNDAFYNRVVERWPAAKAAFQGVLSYVNTQLRDHYSYLSDFCSSNNIDINDLVGKMHAINYSYDEKTNQFK